MTDAAPIYRITEDATRAETTAWAKFSAAKDSAEFCTSWLAILCMQIERVNGGLLLLGLTRTAHMCRPRCGRMPAGICST